MFENCFLSSVVNVRQHRTQAGICVVRVRDSLQTYAGEWQKLKLVATSLHAGATSANSSSNSNNNDNDNREHQIRIFGHGTQVCCKWDTLDTVLQNHMILCAKDSARNSNWPDKAVVVVHKFHRLISFGIALANSDSTLVVSKSNESNRLLLTRHPPVLRHLLDQPCTVLEWRATDIFIGTLEIDSLDNSYSLHLTGNNYNDEDDNNGDDDAAAAADKLVKLVEKFCRTYMSRFCAMQKEKFGKKVKGLCISLMLRKDARRDNEKVRCSRITIANDTNTFVTLTLGSTATLCSDYSIPGVGKVLLYRFGGGIAGWLRADFVRETESHSEKNYYNRQNDRLFYKLNKASGQKDVLVFSDSQALHIMKLLQNNCDQHCTSTTPLAGGLRCDGFLVQFEQLPALHFCLPSLYFLLQSAKAQSVSYNDRNQ